MSEDSPSVSKPTRDELIFRAVLAGDLASLNDLLHVVEGEAALDLEVRSRRGRTPLMLACLHSQGEAATMLLEAGASIEATVEQPFHLQVVQDPPELPPVPEEVAKPDPCDEEDAFAAAQAAEESIELDFDPASLESADDERLEFDPFEGEPEDVAEQDELDINEAIGDFLGFEILFPDGSASVVAPADFPDSVQEVAAVDELPEVEDWTARDERDDDGLFDDPRDPESALGLPELNSVLDFAVAACSCVLLRKLLAAGADPNAISSVGSTLQRAVLQGDADMTAMLLAYGADADLGVDTPPLVLASQAGNSALIAQLLEMGADVDARDSAGRSAIVAACVGGHWRVVEKLLAAEVDLNVSGDSADPIVVAAHGGHRDLVDLLLPLVNKDRRRRAEQILAGAPRRSQATVDLGELLVAAAQLGDLEEVEQILETGVEVDYVAQNGCTALMMAVTYGFPKLVDYLLEWKSDVNITSRRSPHETALIMAASSFFVEDRPALIARLVEAGADLEAADSYGNTPLLATMTLGEGYSDAVATLIEFGADVAARDKDGNTALMVAVQGGYDEIARMLRNEEAERDGLEEIALLEACEQVNLEAVSDLILAGADVNYRCGWTPLIVSAAKGSVDIVDMLLKVGADPDRCAGEEHGEPPYTPLLLAAHRGHLEVVERLLEAGADSSVEIPEVGGPLAYARIGRHEARERCGDEEEFEASERWDRLIALLEEAESSLSSRSPSSGKEPTKPAKNRVVA